MAGTDRLAVRLGRLAAAEERSREAHDDDVRALHAAVREAEAAGLSVRAIARAVGKSVTHTHRIMAGLTGPGVD